MRPPFLLTPLRLRFARATAHPTRRCISSSSLSHLLPGDHKSSRREDCLVHIHLANSTAPSPLSSSSPCNGYPTYAAVSELQASIRQLFLSHKSSVAHAQTGPSPSSSPPPPVLLSFTPQPTYTLGRRQSTLTQFQESRLRQPLFTPPPPPSSFNTQNITANETEDEHHHHHHPAVIQTDRGGLTTYHGPGQIVLWPILDIHSPHHTRFTVRSYARCLEQTTQSVLSTLGIETYLSEADPGVWVTTTSQQDRRFIKSPTAKNTQSQKDEKQHPQYRDGAADAHPPKERKIAAMGVHLRRHITGLGVALNLDVPTTGTERTNPWARFVPCGLEGKAVTSLRAELGEKQWARAVREQPGGEEAVFSQHLAQMWAAQLAKRLGISSVESSVLEVGVLLDAA